MKLRLIHSREVIEPQDTPGHPYGVATRADKERTLLTLLPLVRGTVYRMLGPRFSRDDVVQDALIQIAGALDRFEGRSSLETYARLITVRVAYRAMGRVPKHSESEEPADLPTSDASPERALEQREALSRLHRCLSRLPENRRVAFILCGIEEMSPQDAAKLVGTSPGSMRARYMHARRELARMLGLKLEEGSDVES